MTEQNGLERSSATERKACIDCEFFDLEVGNIYGVCVAGSYIDGEDEFHLEWICAEAMPCNRFREVVE